MVGLTSFSFTIQFARSLITSLGALPTDQDFSVVRFATDVFVASTLESWRQAGKTLNQLRYTQGGTNLAGAIEACQLTLDSSPSDRSNLMLILTDGEPTEPQNAEAAARNAAADAKAQGTFIIPIMIEPPSQNSPEVIFLRNDISSDGNVFVADFDGLSSLSDAVFDQVACQS